MIYDSIKLVLHQYIVQTIIQEFPNCYKSMYATA